MFMGFTLHFYIIFWTNLLTGGPTHIVVFLPISVFRRKRNIKRSPNGMKPLGAVFLERKRSRRLGVEVKEASRRPQGRGRALHPRGPLVAPTAGFFCLYISMCAKNIEANNRSGVPPPHAAVATKNLSGACSGTLPEGGSLTGGHLHHPSALHDEEGVVHPRG